MAVLYRVLVRETLYFKDVGFVELEVVISNFVNHGIVDLCFGIHNTRGTAPHIRPEAKSSGLSLKCETQNRSEIQYVLIFRNAIHAKGKILVL